MTERSCWARPRTNPPGQVPQLVMVESMPVFRLIEARWSENGAVKLEVVAR